MDALRQALLRAFDLAAGETGKGGRAKLAAKLGITPQAISQWDKVPVERVASVSAATGQPNWELRPDIFPPPAEAAE